MPSKPGPSTNPPLPPEFTGKGRDLSMDDLKYILQGLISGTPASGPLTAAGEDFFAAPVPENTVRIVTSAFVLVAENVAAQGQAFISVTRKDDTPRYIAGNTGPIVVAGVGISNVAVALARPWILYEGDNIGYDATLIPSVATIEYIDVPLGRIR